MKFKTSFFNKALMKDDWRRLWPLEVIYTVIAILIIPLRLKNQFSCTSEENLAFVETIARNFMLGECTTSVYLALFMDVLLAMSLFGYLMRSQSANLMHAFPVSRRTHYLSHWMVGVEMFSVGNAIVAVLTLGVEAMYSAGDGSGILFWFILSELTHLFFFGLAVFSTMLTGWLFIIPVVYVGLNALVIAMTSLIQLMASFVYYGYDTVSYSGLVELFTPVYKMTEAYQPIYDYTKEYIVYTRGNETLCTMCIYGASSVVLFLLAYALYKHRKSESAGDIVAFEWLKPMAKQIISLVGGMTFGMILTDMILPNTSNLWAMYAFQVLGGALFIVGCNMLISKSVRVFHKKTLVDGLILTGILLMTVLCISADITGFEARVPEVNAVDAVTINGSHDSHWRYSRVSDSDYIQKTIQMHQKFIARGDSGQDAGYYVEITYWLKNGKKMTRNYLYDGSDSDELLDAINLVENHTAVKVAERQALESEEDLAGGYFINNYSGQSTQLTKNQCEELRKAILMDSDIEGVTDVRNQPNYVHAEIEFDFEGGKSIYLNMDASDEHTIQWLEINGIVEHFADLIEGIEDYVYD